MLQALRIAVAAVGLLTIVLGLLFLVHPAWMAAHFYLTPIGSQGLATLRADFTGFFLAGGIFALLGARSMRPEPLNVPLVLLGIALFGRFISLIFDGVGPNRLPADDRRSRDDRHSARCQTCLCPTPLMPATNRPGRSLQGVSPCV
jgi:hypothetical protein